MRIPIDFVLECIARRFVKTEAVPLYTYDARRTIIVRLFVKAVELRAFSARVHFVQETPLLYEPTNNFGARRSIIVRRFVKSIELRAFSACVD